MTDWLFSCISRVYHHIMEVLGRNNRIPVEHSEKESVRIPVQCTDITYNDGFRFSGPWFPVHCADLISTDGFRFSVRLPVQFIEQEFTYEDDFCINYEKFPVQDTQGLNYHINCSKIR